MPEPSATMQALLAEARGSAPVSRVPGDPRAVESRLYLAAFRVRQNQYEEAVALLRGLDSLPPDAHNDLGAALAGLGRHEEAAAEYRRAIEAVPDHPNAHHNLALSLLALEKGSEALKHFERALDLRQDFTAAYRNLIETLLTLERSEEALRRAEAALQREPDNPDFCFDKGRALMQLSRHSAALAQFEKAVERRPDFVKARLSLGAALSALDRHDEGIAYLRRLSAAEPQNAGVHLGLGHALAKASRHEESLVSYEAALRLEPELAAAYHGRGLVQQTLGRLAESRAAFRAAVALAPGDPGFWRSAGESKRYVPNDPDLATLEGLADRIGDLPDSKQILLHFALVKAYDDVGRHRRAAEHAVAGGALQRKSMHHNEGATIAMFRRVASIFTAEALRTRRGEGHRSSVPVFIFAMPRSGTTLVEQVLASHPDVHGAGELSHIRAAAGALHWEDGSRAYPDIVPSLTADALRRLGADYIAEAHAGAPAAARVTDKMPENFVHLGLIHLALPNARLIHVRRHPGDVCLSNFFTLFTHQPHTFNMAELGCYYRAYDTLMAHWRRVLPPETLIEVRYEDLVADFDRQAKRLLAHIDLPWHQRCLTFQETERPVRTASVLQVRRPLYTASVGRWRPYKRLLAPMFDPISDIISNYERCLWVNANGKR